MEEEAVAEVETEAEAETEMEEAEMERAEEETAVEEEREEAAKVEEAVEAEADLEEAKRGHRLQISLEHEDGTRSSRRMPFLCIDDTRRQESCIRLLTCLLLPIQTCRRRQGA